MLGRHENGEVKHAVLFRAHQFLAVEKQDGDIAAIDDLQLRNVPALAQLGDRHPPTGECVVEHDVAGLTVAVCDQRRQGEVLERHRGSALDTPHRIDDSHGCCHCISLRSGRCRFKGPRETHGFRLRQAVLEGAKASEAQGVIGIRLHHAAIAVLALMPLLLAVRMKAA